MAFAEKLEVVSKAPLKIKALALVGASVLLVITFYLLLYSAVEEDQKRLEGQISMLEEEVSSYEEKKQKYMAFRAEVNSLLEEQKELIKVLPAEAEIPSFLKSLHAQGELSGLNILTFQPGVEEKKNFYARIPVKMSLSGTFHQVLRFFYNVGRLKRIVNIENVILGSPEETDQGVLLKAQFLASTFRFISPDQSPSQNPKKKG